MQNEKKKTNKLIHVGRIQPHGSDVVYLFLRQFEDRYIWMEDNSKGEEKEISIPSFSIADALFMANKTWKPVFFRTVNCGFRYTLPERDEHGLNALFHEMAASYSSMNGQYFDEDLGHMCIVHNASEESRTLLERLKAQNRL